MSVSSRLSTASLSSTIRPLTATTPGATPAITPDFSPDSPLIMDKQVTIGLVNLCITSHFSSPEPLRLNVSVCNPRMYTGLQIYGGPGSLSYDFKICPITFQGSGPSGRCEKISL